MTESRADRIVNRAIAAFHEIKIAHTAGMLMAMNPFYRLMSFGINRRS